ncbi:hypothetical protein D3C80_127210 [compost metagenome]
MNDLLVAKNIPTAAEPSLMAAAQGGLEDLLKVATEKAGQLLVENEMDEAEALAEAVRGGRRAMAILHELQDELGRRA